MLRRQIDHDDFDAAVFSLDAVAADLGYGDVRALPAVAWIDRLRDEDKRIALAAAGERARPRSSSPASPTVRRRVTARPPLGGGARGSRRRADRAVVVGATPPSSTRRAPPASSWRSASPAGRQPEHLRRAGAIAVVADLQELLR